MNKTQSYRLPSLPEHYRWSITDYVGSHKSGFYDTGTRVLIQIKEKRSFLGFTWNRKIINLRSYIAIPNEMIVLDTAKKLLVEFNILHDKTHPSNPKF